MTTNVSGDINKSDINKGGINKGSNNSLLIGILLTVLGIAAFAVPRVTTIFAETWIALILISSAAAKLSYAFQTRNEGGFVWKLLLSILYFATGVMLFVYPLTGVLTLTLLLGSFLLTEGVFELILAFRLRPQQNWTWALGNGVITLLLGAMIWFQWPFNAPWVIGTLVSVSILSTGISRIMLSLNSRYALNHSDSATQA
jgi:uncharacterized membrane protein HdeD (DUF308 family)